MNRRKLLPAFGSALAAGLFVAACSSSAATSAPTLPAVPSIAIPSIAIPSIAIPSIAIPSIAIPSIAIPSFALPSSVPSFALPSIPTGSDIPSFELPSFSFPSEDKDLEAKLPSTINGVTLTKYSFKGGDFLEAGASNSQDLLDLLTALGKTPNDLSVAFAGDPAGNLDVQIGAFRVAGADSNALLAGFIASANKETPEEAVSQGNVGGKNVTQITDPTDPTTGTVYVYANGDTLFYVESSDASLAGAALQALP
jgi:hypothetical protein